MTSDQAIEILTSLEKTLAPTMAASGTDAIQLGIEALKWRRLMEDSYGSWCGPLLPGETPEIDNHRSLHHIKQVLGSPEVSK